MKNHMPQINTIVITILVVLFLLSTFNPIIMTIVAWSDLSCLLVLYLINKEIKKNNKPNKTVESNTNIFNEYDYNFLDYESPETRWNRMLNNSNKLKSTTLQSIDKDIFDSLITSDFLKNNINISEQVRYELISGPRFIDQTLIVNLNSDKYTTPKAHIGYGYKSLSPEQKGLYIQYLMNPYGEFENSYSLLLLMTLEKQLVYGNKEVAAHVILRLYDNSHDITFQRHAFSALLYYYKSKGLLDKFLEREYDNLDIDFVIYYHELKDGVLPADVIIKHRTAFKYRKYALINRDPIKFHEKVNEILQNQYGIMGLPLKLFNFQFLPNNYLYRFPLNGTIRNIPSDFGSIKYYSGNDNMKDTVYNILEKAYMLMK